ncbi:MAG: N-6 DNA methylase [Nitrospirae bacterium]|nr:N-6 DNA methylase [Nitrospirota bacterium]
MLKSYVKKIFEVAKRGDAREESYYSCLEELLNDYADSINKKQIYITTLPKKTDAGNPDFRIWDGKQHIIGYIEAKSLHEEDLTHIEHSEQLERYLDIFPNLILTNFFEFRLYRDGNLIDKIRIARPYVIHKLGTVPPVEKEKEFFALLEKFFSFSLPKTYSAKTLAVELAKRTRFLKEQVIIEELKTEETPPFNSPLTNGGLRGVYGFYEAFKQYLISGLSKEDFADLYSQTITYGLFAARTRSENSFNRKLAYDRIPRTIGILRDVFRFISLGELPQQMEWIIDDISEVLAVTDVYKILDEYFHKHKGKDPIVHFYETFLAEYDPKTREKRGVYYTPEPVVSYIVRSLHHILKEHFNRADGFANDTVTVLDPAAGTLTFLAEAAKLAVNEFSLKYGEGAKENFIKEQILKNFYAFELMMAPYAIGHLKISFLLEELGYKLHEDDRFKLYLTNTLEMEELAQTELPGMASLSEESHLAGKVKKEQPILVILGNPPYSVSSANKSDFIEKEMELYKKDVRIEKNIQPLSDDYIKFIRFAHWKIDKAGKGIIGMITNNSYLSGLIHRGMRKSLLESFNEIYILNLHGNSRIGEKCPDGSKDENVFDIQQGVSIALFVKNDSVIARSRATKQSHEIATPSARNDITTCKVFYQDVYGLRKKKYAYLNKYSTNSTKWIELTPTDTYYFFVKKDFSLQAKYDKFLSIQEIFVQSSSGVKTHRDHFIVGFTKEEVKQRIRTFTSNLPDEIVTQGLNLKDTRDWKVKTARESLKKIDWGEYVRPYSYRPFDKRYICYLSNLIDRGCDRWDLMKNFFKENIGLATTRRMPEIFGVSTFVCNYVGDIHIIGDQNYFFPLYLYKTKEDNPSKKRSFSTLMMLFEPEADYFVKKPNLSPAFVEKLTKEFKKTPTPEQIFFYIYAILYSNIYRIKYAEFLKIDFPRIPFTKDYKLFKKMGDYGERLVDLHLLKSSALDSPVAKLQGKGDNKIEKVWLSLRGKAKAISKDEILRYAQNDKLVIYINQNQYFEGLSNDVWGYQIGGYQVCDKWLKDRKGKRLSLEDIKYYCKIVTALKKTIEIQKAIDNVYPEVEKETLSL